MHPSMHSSLFQHRPLLGLLGTTTPVEGRPGLQVLVVVVVDAFVVVVDAFVVVVMHLLLLMHLVLLLLMHLLLLLLLLFIISA